MGALVKLASDPLTDQIDKEIQDYEALDTPTGGWYSRLQQNSPGMVLRFQILRSEMPETSWVGS